MQRLIFAAVMAACCASPARAQMTVEDKEVLAKTLVAEAGWRRLPDHAAILHVLERRSRLPELGGKNLAQTAQAYAAMWRVHEPKTPHLKRVFAMSWDSAPGWLRGLIDDFVVGAVEDPCRGRAWHWGSYEDARKRVGWRTANCGPTSNVFFAGGANPVVQPRPRPFARIGRPERELFALDDSESPTYVVRPPFDTLAMLVRLMLLVTLTVVTTWILGRRLSPPLEG